MKDVSAKRGDFSRPSGSAIKCRNSPDNCPRSKKKARNRLSRRDRLSLHVRRTLVAFAHEAAFASSTKASS